MKVLFLDIDGVLNSRDSLDKCVVGNGQRLDPAAVKRLARVVDMTGCKVVISSPWRLAFPLAEIAGRLGALGLPPGSVIDATPRYGLPAARIAAGGAEITPDMRRDETRGLQIDAWLRLHDDVEVFAIVDDESDMRPHMARLVKTTWERGLEEEHVSRLVTMLGVLDDRRQGTVRRRSTRAGEADHPRRLADAIESAGAGGAAGLPPGVPAVRGSGARTVSD